MKLLKLIVCAGLMCTAFAKSILVSANNASDLTSKVKNAVAGDTIVVPAGTYNLTSSVCSATKDIFKGNGRDLGCLWAGNNGTASNPIVVMGADPANPPSIVGPGTSTSYYVAHITGDYVYFKNLKIGGGSKTLIIDYADNVVVEDCELYGSGTELVHVRDSSQNARINRNFIHGSGQVTGKYGEGVYVGTYPGSWYTRNSDERSKLSAPDNNGYDWRVNGTQITCNVIKATTAEPVDVKEGVDGVQIKGNMFVADWLATESGAPDYDDAYIDMKGINAIVTGNYMYDSKNASLPFYNVKFKYFVEEVANKDANAVAWENATGIKVRPDAYTSSGWCDKSTTDNNKCYSTDNHVVNYIRDVRNDCGEIVKIPGGSAISYSNVDIVAADEIRLPNGHLWYSSSSVASSSSSAKSSSSNAKSSSSIASSSSAKSSSSSAKSSSSSAKSSSSSAKSSSSVAVSSSSAKSSSSSWNGTAEMVYYEAESANHGSAEVKTHADAHGGSYVIVKDQNVVFTVNVAAAGTYDVVVRYSNTAQNAKTQTIQVNGSKLMDKEFPVTLGGNVGGANAKFEEFVIPMTLNAGSNTIGFIKSWGYVDLDCIAITIPETASSSSSAISSSSSAKSSSSSAKSSSSSVKSSSSSAKSSSSSVRSSSSNAKSSSSVASSSSSAKSSSSSAKSSSSEKFSSSSAKSSSSIASSSSAKSSSSSVEAIEQSSSSESFSSSTQAVELQTSSSMEILESSSSETYTSGSDDLINDEPSSSSYEIPYSDSNEQGVAVVLPGKYAMVPVLGKVFRLKVPSSENYRVNVFDYNGNVVQQLHSGRYIIRVESRNYNYVTSVLVK